MRIEIIDQRNTWESFVLNYHPNSLLQSWNWGEFAKKQGRKKFRLGIFDNWGLKGTALFTKITSLRGDYLECHGGPLMDWSDSEVFDELVGYLLELAKKEKVHFIRIRPPLFYSPPLKSLFGKRGFVPAPMYFQAEHTLHLDLSLSEENLLANMRKNTRYGIRKAQKEGVKVSRYAVDSHRVSDVKRPISKFFKLYQQTVNRQDFVPYNLDYFENEIGSFWQDNQVALFLSEWRGQPVAATIVLFYGDFAYYHHGASVHTQPDVFASYLAQWEAIKEAKKRGCRKYDFWGVAPAGAGKAHPRAGLTFFKEGFGGDRVRWMSTMDLPVAAWRYWPMYVFVKYERWRRGL